MWHVKKDDFTATCKLYNTDINIAHVGYSALTQHSEKKHKGFSLTLEKVKDHEKGKELEKSKSKECQKVLQDFFVKSSEGTSKPTTSSQESGNSPQDKGSSTSQDTAKACQEVWSLPQMATKAEIIAALQFCFTKCTLQLCRCTPGMPQAIVPDSVIAKYVVLGPKKMSYMVAYGLG